MFVGFTAFGWLAHIGNESTGLLGWYTTVVWTLPVTVTVVGLAGATITAARLRHEETYGSATVRDLLIVVVPTIGRVDTLPALERVLHSYCDYLPTHFPQLRVDIVIEENCEARDRIAALAAGSPLIRLVVIPQTYRTPNGTRFKARANHFVHELRITEGEATDCVWVLHMDDDTAVGEDTTRSLARFVSEQPTRDGGHHLAQGVLTYPREYAGHGLTWLADAVRPGCDVSLFAASTGLGSPRAGLHGEFLLVRASAEASIGWDFGPRAIVEDAEFALRFCQLYPGCSSWISGRCYGASPATVRDFLRQRERWVWGLLELTTKASVPLRQRLFLMHNVVVWICAPIQHPVMILFAGAVLGDLDTTPAFAVLVPVWALNVSYIVWLYWEGLKINAASSAAGRRTPRDVLMLVGLLPLFSLWETIGVGRGIAKFLRRTESRFTVITKPI